jgi:tellurite resistance protein TerC
MDVMLFPFSEYWWLYLSFSGMVIGLLLLDLGVFHRSAHAVSIKESAIWSVVWVALALIFGACLYKYALHTFPENARLMMIPGFDAAVAAKQVGLEYLTGYVIEKALAVDNLFVFVIVFNYFAIPAIYQHRILFFGILGALIFRAIFIALGAALLQYHIAVLIAGAFLIITGVKILFSSDEAPDPSKNPVIRYAKKILPVTDEIHGQHFFVRKNNKWFVTPLFMALLFVEFSDIVFAIDSVPAIFAITKEPLIVFTSNIFAILGLRSLYFMLSGVMDKFHMIKYGLGLILVFVGLKMVWLNDAFDGKFPIGWSLGIIGLFLGLAIVLSLVIKPKSDA